MYPTAIIEILQGNSELGKDLVIIEKDPIRNFCILFFLNLMNTNFIKIFPKVKVNIYKFF